MITTASVQIPVDTKDPVAAVRTCIELVRANAARLEPLEINLGVNCGARCDVLLRLAQELPGTALGFTSMGSYRAQTTDEFTANPPASHGMFDGDLTEYFPATKALALIERLLESPKQALRSTAFYFHAKKIQWKGSPSDSSGSIDLFDLKGLGRAKRFSLSASLQINDGDDGAPAFSDTIKQVAKKTGIPFDKGTITRSLGEQSYSPAYAHALLVATICFDEVVEEMAGQFPNRWVSEFAPNAVGHDEAFSKRAHQWGAEGSGKVNLVSLLKRIVRQTLREFNFKSADAEVIMFQRPVGRNYSLILSFNKSFLRLGKAFTMALGIDCPRQSMRFTANAFRFERTTEEKMWIYADGAEAKGVAEEAANLARQLLPGFESCLRAHFEPWPAEVPADIVQHGPLTAREAFENALPTARQLFPDAELIRLFNHARSLQVRDIEGPELSFDGRLTLNGEWWFHFYSPRRDVSFQITVPFAGRIQAQDHGAQYQNPNTRNYLVAVGNDWLDSDQIFALVEARGGRERRTSGKPFGVCTKLFMPPSGLPCWEVEYLLTDQRGRNDLTVRLAAKTGAAIDDPRGC